MGKKYFPNDVNSKKFDILFINNRKYTELKNIDFSNATNLPTQVIEQMISPKGAFGKINSLDNLEWIAYARRGNTETKLTQLGKKAFIDNAENMFKPVNQGGLGKDKMKQLFEFGEYEFDSFIEFQDYLNEKEFLDNALKFVKAE